MRQLRIYDIFRFCIKNMDNGSKMSKVYPNYILQTKKSKFLFSLLVLDCLFWSWYRDLFFFASGRGGAKWPTANQKRYISGTECPIDLKPGCKFKFLCCFEVYIRKLIHLDHEGALAGPFLPRVP